MFKVFVLVLAFLERLLLEDRLERARSILIAERSLDSSESEVYRFPVNFRVVRNGDPDGLRRGHFCVLNID